jgi:hypothetical protein
MDKSLLVSNPFALMMNPAEVLLAMENSDRLARLHRRICKPLDKPLAANSTDDTPGVERDADERDDFLRD